jgi:hypothetical protein
MHLWRSEDTQVRRESRRSWGWAWAAGIIAGTMIACADATAPWTLMPAGVCRFTEFLFEDSAHGIRYGPELQGEMTLTVDRRDAATSTWEAHTEGLRVGYHSPDYLAPGSDPDTSSVAYATLFLSGDYFGFWQLRDDGIWWVVDTERSQRVLLRLGAKPWEVRGPALLADWVGDADYPYHLRMTVLCGG